MRDVNGGMKILGLESLVLNRILYIAPRRAVEFRIVLIRQRRCSARKGASRSRFSVIVTWHPENSGLYPNQPPQMRTSHRGIQTTIDSTSTINFLDPPKFSQFNDKVSRDSARRARQLLVGAGRYSATGRRIRLNSTNEPHIRTATHAQAYKRHK
ncbi:hypothetical protein NA56DRAFT_262471 [Hyaloscypha hepaticicola]|uniref:Uncharacterized protein n=1 Tax=Hyaloscypha hepaticicola TaxID=2082293 RepID=A0A2J6PUD9_9HELO|nr:hypothetical protein NA56DRAFT_262471 [Hyaloscypha hepaticicola]